MLREKFTYLPVEQIRCYFTSQHYSIYFLPLRVFLVT